MALYESLFADAVPVVKKGKKKSGKTITPDNVVIEEAPPAVVKQKRVMSDTQKAALAAGRERKKAAAEALKQAEVAAKNAVEQEAEALKAKKEAANEKRRLARLAKKNAGAAVESQSNEETLLDNEIDVAVKELEKKSRKRKTVVKRSETTTNLKGKV